MILKVADVAPIKSPPMKYAENGQITGAIRLKLLPGAGRFGRDSFELFGTLYEKGGEELSNSTRQIDILSG